MWCRVLSEVSPTVESTARRGASIGMPCRRHVARWAAAGRSLRRRLTVGGDEGPGAVHVLPRGQDADDRAGIRSEDGPGPDDPPRVRRRLARRGRARDEEAGEEQGEGEEEGPGGTGSAGGARHRVVEGRGVCGFGGGRRLQKSKERPCNQSLLRRQQKRSRLRRGGPSSPLGRSYRSSHVHQSLNMHVHTRKNDDRLSRADVGRLWKKKLQFVWHSPEGPPGRISLGQVDVQGAGTQRLRRDLPRAPPCASHFGPRAMKVGVQGADSTRAAVFVSFSPNGGDRVRASRAPG